MIRNLRVSVLAVSFGCAPSGSQIDEEPQEERPAADVQAQVQLDAPRWFLGQTWYVTTHSFGYPTGHDSLRPPITDRWRCEVIDVDDAGVVDIEARLLDSDGKQTRGFRWQTSFRESGSLIKFHATGETSPLFQFRGAPFVPFMSVKGVPPTMIPPWWPEFPLVPGQKLSFEDGAITQSTREVDGLFEVELVAHPPKGKRGPWRGVTTYWERDRPYWSKIDVVYVPESGIPYAQYQYRGEVVSWDRANPWALP